MLGAGDGVRCRTTLPVWVRGTEGCPVGEPPDTRRVRPTRTGTGIGRTGGTRWETTRRRGRFRLRLGPDWKTEASTRATECPIPGAPVTLGPQSRKEGFYVSGLILLHEERSRFNFVPRPPTRFLSE